MKIEIFTDGSCDDRRFGGFGVFLKIFEKGVLTDTLEYCEGHQDVTSTQMELKAVVYALDYLKSNFLMPESIDLFSDYFDVSDNLTGNINLKSNTFTTSKDAELWNEIYQKSLGFNINYHWIKSHNGHEENTKVDALANLGRMRFILSLKEKVFVYYHQSLNVFKTPTEYAMNILFDFENGQYKVVKKQGVFEENRPDKGFYSLYLLKEMLEYTISNVKSPNDKKIIIFIENTTFIKTISALKRGSFKVEDQRYPYLWESILSLIKNNDIEIHKNNAKRLDSFELSEEKHEYYTAKVQKLVA